MTDDDGRRDSVMEKNVSNIFIVLGEVCTSGVISF